MPLRTSQQVDCVAGRWTGHSLKNEKPKLAKNEVDDNNAA